MDDRAAPDDPQNFVRDRATLRNFHIQNLSQYEIVYFDSRRNIKKNINIHAVYRNTE